MSSLPLVIKYCRCVLPALLMSCPDSKGNNTTRSMEDDVRYSLYCDQMADISNLRRELWLCASGAACPSWPARHGGWLLSVVVRACG